jgi:hypothetical protein
MNTAAKQFLNLAERAGTTFAEQFITVMLGTGAVSLVASPHWTVAGDRAGFAALVSIGTSLLTFGVPKLPAGIDAILRVLKTGLQVFLGDLIASSATPSLVHADWRHALAAGVVVMGPAALKVIGALGISTTDGAALIPHSLSATAITPDQLNYVLPTQLDYPTPDTQTAPPGAVDPATAVTAPHVEANLAEVGVTPPVDPTATTIDPSELAYPVEAPATDSTVAPDPYVGLTPQHAAP